MESMAIGVNATLAAASAAVSGVFALMVFRQFVGRRKPFQLAWGIGLALFTLASSLELISELQGWDVLLYRLYFALHPTLVAILGLGTVYLLADKRWGHGFLAYIAAMTGLLLVLVATVEVDAGAFADFQGRVVGARGMPDEVRNLSLLFTIPGSVALIGGALYSWWRTRGGYNLLIAGGAALMASGGTLTRQGLSELLYIFLLLGIAILFVGFLRSLEVSTATRAVAVPSGAE